MSTMPEPTPQQIQQVSAAVGAGVPPDDAALRAGIRDTDFAAWMEKGETEIEGPYRDLYDAVKKSEGDAAARDEALLTQAAKVDWRAAAWRIKERERAKLRRRIERLRASGQECGPGDLPTAVRGSPSKGDAAENEQVVWNLRGEGRTQREIAELTGLSRTSVQRILERVKARAVEMLTEQEVDIRIRHLAHHEYMAAKAMAEWRLSQNVGAGDPRYLGEARLQLVAGRAIVGADAPLEIKQVSDADSPQHKLAEALLGIYENIDAQEIDGEPEPESEDNPEEIAELPEPAGEAHDDDG